MPLVFQYGSNCDAARLNDRLAAQGGAEDLGRAETVDEYDIAFDVWSQSNACAASDLVAASGTGRHAWGALYRISDAGLDKLRKVEGKLYEEAPVRVRKNDGLEPEEKVVTFLVKTDEHRQGLWTSRQYVYHIAKGLRDHEVPEEYVTHVIDIAIESNVRAAYRALEEDRHIRSLHAVQSGSPSDPTSFYFLEDYLFGEVHAAFHARGYLTPEEFFCIVIWKANRAKSKIKQKLARHGSDLALVIENLTRQIHDATDDQARLRLLLDDWQFALPMASAILTVLYPDRFTVYDVRVRNELHMPDFSGRRNQVEAYFGDFLPKVEATGRGGSLRDKDRFLFGQSFYRGLRAFLK